MTFMQWNDGYSVGNSKMDDQHKGLIDLINMLDDTSMTGIALERLKSYANEHFRDEERLLEAAGYPDLDGQKTEHRDFEDWLADVHRTWVTGNGPSDLREDVQRHLKEWLTNHILKSDRAYTNWVA